MFLNYFDMLILKMNFKNKKKKYIYIYIYIQPKNILKNNIYHTLGCKN